MWSSSNKHQKSLQKVHQKALSSLSLFLFFKFYLFSLIPKNTYFFLSFITYPVFLYFFLLLFIPWPISMFGYYSIAFLLFILSQLFLFFPSFLWSLLFIFLSCFTKNIFVYSKFVFLFFFSHPLLTFIIFPFNFPPIPLPPVCQEFNKIRMSSS